MPELTDDQLDGLFRKSAEEFDPPFDPAAWRDMKTRLDANDRTLSGGSSIWNKLLRWGLPLGLLLLLSGGGWYAYHRVHSTVVKSTSRMIPGAEPTLNRNKKRPQPVGATPTFDNEPVRTTTVGSKESDAAKQPTDSVASVAEPARSAERLDKPVTGLKRAPASDPDAATKRSELTYELKTERTRLTDLRLAKSVDAGRKNVVEMASGRKVSTKGQIAGVTKRQRKSDAVRFGETRVAMNYAMGSTSRNTKRKRSTNHAVVETLVNAKVVETSGNVTSPGISENNPVAFPGLAKLTVRPAKWPKLLSFTGREVVAQPDTTARRVVANRTSERGLSIRAVVAPDLSSVGLKNFSKPGTNIGLLLEYRLAPRWSVQAGVIQSTKVYRALPGEYTASYTEWNGHVKPESIDGRCNMLDLPINLRYDIGLRPGRDGRSPNRLFVSGGVTSYIVNKEHYVYNYPPLGYAQREGRDTTTNGYGFSHLNLSIGYERAFSKRLSWQVEPFIKVPLKGVGYFKSNLISTGAFFSIRYKLSR